MALIGKIAIVSGATRGIGKAIAKKLLANGANVAICGRNEELLKDLQTENTLAFKADVSNPTDCQAFVDAVIQKWGKIDILVNNAGITRDNLLLRMTDEEWNSVLNINLTGAFNLCRAAIRPMLKQRSGKIVNISSVIGIVGNTGQTNYAASKAGLIGFSKALAKETASRGILVNIVAPGYIDTDMTQQLSDKHKEMIASQIPLGRTGTVEDVANTVYFLVSDMNKYITGQIINVDGGLVM
ncbi:MAG: 3-oxoacyl-[acyl-carrier-protein] reductase [Firmicutes bacterium]|nr:3-oxoacyl-[acyl-carrier-protein] reductase [Bacillota bacterium]